MGRVVKYISANLTPAEPLQDWTDGEIGHLLDIDEHTAARHLCRLEQPGFAVRLGKKQGYVLGRRCQAEPRSADEARAGVHGAAFSYRWSAPHAGQFAQNEAQPPSYKAFACVNNGSCALLSLTQSRHK
jgi:hypothetical protein